MNQVESKNVIINLKQANIEMQNKSLKNKSPLNSSLNEFFMTQEEKEQATISYSREIQKL